MLYKYVNEYKDKDSIILIPRKISRLEFTMINDKNKLLDEVKNDIWYDFHIPKKIDKNILKMFFSINKKYYLDFFYCFIQN